MARNRVAGQFHGSIHAWSWLAAPSDGAVIAETQALFAHVGASAAPVVVLMPAAVLAPGSLAVLQQQLFLAACELARAVLAPPRHERIIASCSN